MMILYHFLTVCLLFQFYGVQSSSNVNLQIPDERNEEDNVILRALSLAELSEVAELSEENTLARTSRGLDLENNHESLNENETERELFGLVVQKKGMFYSFAHELAHYRTIRY